MVKAIMQVTSVMGMQTIAEFVEDKESFDFLREIGIDYAQGYWIGKPKPISEVFNLEGSANPCSLRVVTSN
jgi:EAL domain-containing protein (putative c-di-GMP-specific phosphodiesterase class I)